MNLRDPNFLQKMEAQARAAGMPEDAVQAYMQGWGKVYGDFQQQTSVKHGLGIMAAGAAGGAALGGLGAAAGAAGSTGATGAAAGGLNIPAIAGGLGTAGRIAGGIADSRGQNRYDQNNQNAGFDQTRLAFANHELTAPSQRAHNSVQGDILAGVQPVTSTGASGHRQISGGISPALLSENSRALGRDMSRQALTSQMEGPMTPTPMQQPSGADSFLSGLGYAGLAADTWNASKPQIPQIRRSPAIPQIPQGPIPGIPMDTLPERRWYF